MAPVFSRYRTKKTFHMPLSTELVLPYIPLIELAVFFSCSIALTIEFELCIEGGGVVLSTESGAEQMLLPLPPPLLNPPSLPPILVNDVAQHNAGLNGDDK